MDYPAGNQADALWLLFIELLQVKVGMPTHINTASHNTKCKKRSVASGPILIILSLVIISCVALYCKLYFARSYRSSHLLFITGISRPSPDGVLIIQGTVSLAWQNNPITIAIHPIGSQWYYLSDTTDPDIQTRRWISSVAVPEGERTIRYTSYDVTVFTTELAPLPTRITQSTWQQYHFTPLIRMLYSSFFNRRIIPHWWFVLSLALIFIVETFGVGVMLQKVGASWLMRFELLFSTLLAVALNIGLVPLESLIAAIAVLTPALILLFIQAKTKALGGASCK